jgi:hypothetical protein
MGLPSPASSIIIFVLTFCVGYVTLLFAHYESNKVSEWYDLDVFDKTIQTFIVGGFIAIISFIGLGAPVLSFLYETPESFTSMIDWLSKNLVMMIIVESLLMVTVGLVISLFLARESEITYDYYW